MTKNDWMELKNIVIDQGKNIEGIKLMLAGRLATGEARMSTTERDLNNLGQKVVDAETKIEKIGTANRNLILMGISALGLLITVFKFFFKG